jgi:hypothetical protein
VEGGEKMTNIPSDEDFARAERLDKERSRNLNLVVENTKRHFMRVYPLHNIYLMPQQAPIDIRAYIFFKRDRDLDACRHNGATVKLEAFIRDELIRTRGTRQEGNDDCGF